MSRRPAQPCQECGRPRSRPTKGSGPARAAESGRGLCRCLALRQAQQRRQQHRQQLLTATIVILNGLTSSPEPNLTTERLAELLTTVTADPSSQNRVMAEIIADPGLLTRGGSRMSKLAGTFCYTAIAAGLTGVTSPGCARCGRPKPLFHPIPDSADDSTGDSTDHGVAVAPRRICPDCYTRGHTAPCARCNRVLPVKARTTTGDPLCSGCQADTHREPCHGCGRTLPVRTSTSDGHRYCRTCRAQRAPTAVCADCGRDRRVNARTPTGPLCTTCYAKTRATSTTLTTPCDQCGRLAPLVTRDRNGATSGTTAGTTAGTTRRNLCARCYRHPRRRCGICGRLRRVALRANAPSVGADGLPPPGRPDICPTCYQWPIIDCSICGHPGPGRRTTNDGLPRCFRCQATATIDAALTPTTATGATPDGAGGIPAHLQPLRDALVARDRPLSTLSNLTRTKTLGLLADITNGRLTLTHEALDARQATSPTNSMPTNFRLSIAYLRSLLVSTGALPARDEHLARLHRFTTDLTTDLTAAVPDPAQRALLTRYARWQVIARARPDRHGTLTASVAHRCRDDLRAAAAFLEHLAGNRQTTLTCTQTVLDAWLTGSPRRAGQQGFLRWLRRDGHLPHVQLPPVPPRPTPRAAADDEHRWELARHLLHDPGSASLEDRAAALLILLYAQHVTTLAQLTTDDITRDEDGHDHGHGGQDVYLRLGPQPLLLLPPLDALLLALPVDKPFGAAHVLADRRWLFTGKNAGQHIHPASLMHRMNALGITTRTHRNAALLHLAVATPPAIFASLIGISTVTATRWTELAGGNWTTYATRRRPH